MKALIVDDEAHVRRAIRLLINWERFHIDEVLEAFDGETAIAIVTKEAPEIIFTDMRMPGKNGVELLEWLHAHAPASKTIVVSGHDDFALVRHTVKYGGTDYILKPLDAEQLNDALDKAIAEWKREERDRRLNEQRSREIHQIKPVYWEKIWSNLITEPERYASLGDSFHAEFGLSRDVEECRVVILRLDTLEPSVREKFASNRDLLFFSLINICNEFLRGRRLGAAIRYWNSDNEIVLLLWRELDKSLKLIADINEGLFATLRSRLDFGVGGVHPFPSGLSGSYREAGSALGKRNLLRSDIRIHTERDSGSVQGTVPHMGELEDRWLTAVRSGSAEQIAAAAEAWLDAVKRLECITPELLHVWQQEYAVIQHRWLQQCFADPQERAAAQAGFASGGQDAAALLDERGTLSFARWQLELTRSLTRFSKLLLESRQQDKGIIYEIARYVEANYREAIALQDIAHRFYMSREYISRKFKQEFGVNLSDYVEKIRIEKAKLLLLNPGYRIAEIADMVGYRDEKYFSKVFKKAEGISPNEFRKQETIG